MSKHTPRYYFEDNGGQSIPIFDRMEQRGTVVARVYTVTTAERITRVLNEVDEGKLIVKL